MTIMQSFSIRNFVSCIFTVNFKRKNNPMHVVDFALNLNIGRWIFCVYWGKNGCYSIDIGPFSFMYMKDK